MSAGSRKYPTRISVVPAPKPVSLAATLGRCAIMLAVTGLLLAGIGFVYPMLPVTTTWAAPEHGAAANDPHAKPAKGTQAWVVKKARCKSATGGVMPTSVVADPAGPRSWTHLTGQGFSDALEQSVFDGTMPASEWVQPVDHGMRVGVYCR